MIVLGHRVGTIHEQLGQFFNNALCFSCIGLLFSMFSLRTNDGLAKLFMNITNRVGSLNFVESQTTV